jgi:hypothetical protein
MSAVALDLLAEAHRYGVRLITTPAGTIKARAPKRPPPYLLANLKAHRAELFAALAQAEADDREVRAAIVEYDAGVPRAWTEGYARLHPDRPPADVPPKRWQALIDDIGRFLDSWADKAVLLGWGPHDLFGCDRDRPFARIDQAGLLWLLNGNKLIALTENTAIIETPTGARQTYRRKPGEPDRVLAWELAP